jgi:hydrogenase nickel incorporation protein HypB
MEGNMSSKEIKVMRQILNANDRIAAELNAEMKRRGIVYINLMSSPGSGKTSLLERTATELGKRLFVIEGDIQTTLDAERLARAGVGVYQINTGPFGGDCHLEAGWIRAALEEVNLDEVDYMFVENIGNLVCPAEFSLGAQCNVVVLSVTEGEDKPLKYPLVFRTSQLCLVSKTDLLPYLDLDLDALKANIRKANPGIRIIGLSSKTGSGFADWLAFLAACKA